MVDRALFVTIVSICAALAVQVTVPLPRMLDLYLLPGTFSFALLATVAVLIAEVAGCFNDDDT